MDQAIIENNEFDYKNSEGAQIVSDVLMFRKANQIDVLKSMFDLNSNISDEEVQKILPGFKMANSNINLKEGETI
jgi:hypothetical protein